MTTISGPVIVVGAGLAGLRCARVLDKAGVPVELFEAHDAVGGRVRSAVTPDGFTLGRGFQVLFTAYPALRRAVDLGALDLRLFDNGAAVVTAHGPEMLRDPVRHPDHLQAALTSRVLTWGDRFRLARLAAELVASPWDGVRDVGDEPRTTEQALHARGFSDGFVESFFRPFLAGILLRRDLSTNAAVLQFLLKMLVQGRSALPAHGMQALPDAMAQALPPDSVRLESRVLGLLREAGRAVGVRTAAGEVRGRAVVLATDGDSSATLADVAVPRVSIGSTTMYLAGRDRPYRQKLLALNALPDPFVNDATLLTNVVPEYAPPGWHLLAAHVLHAEQLDDGVVESRARADLARWFPHVDLARWRTLSIARLPHSQFPQPPHTQARLPGARPASGLEGLYLASEVTEDSSINGALRGGEAAAAAVLEDLGTR